MKRNFLVVAANAQVREALAAELSAAGQTVTRAASASAAEQVVRSVAVDAVIVESHLPDMPPAALRERLLELRPECRVVVLTSFEQVRNTAEQLSYGMDHYLLRGAQVLELVQAPYGLADGDGVADPGTDSLVQVVDVLVGLLELDDRFFGGSSHQAMRLARLVSEELAVDTAAVREVVIAALLRDIGKVDVEPDLLSEEGWYSAEQRKRMQTHVESSLKLLEHIDFPWKVLPVIRHHHERYDGTGYPDGLKGREIPLGARIIAAVDAFVALTSGRHHRGPFETEQALRMLIVESGRQFDPEVVESLQRVLDKRRRPSNANAKPRVVLANSQDDFRKVIKMGLVNEGYDVLEARGPEQALELLLKDSPDMVLVDIDADRDDVFRFLREVREDATLCSLPVVFVSRHADRSLRLRALREGVDDFVLKGAELEELVARMQNILTREAVRREGSLPRARRGITGDLENLNLPDIVQTLVVGMKTARVTLKSQKRKGQIWFENGAARHATYADKKGEEAFYEMVSWVDGEFVIEHGLRSKHNSLNKDAMFLVMEGLRLVDESARANTA